MITRLDPTQEIRGAIITALSGDGALTAMIPSSSIYPVAVPFERTFPFIKMGAPITTPRFIDGGDGGDVSGAVHVFAKKDVEGGLIDPESFAMNINSHVIRILNAMDEVALDADTNLSIYPRQAQIMQDGDADSWHAFVTFDAVAS